MIQLPLQLQTKEISAIHFKLEVSIRLETDIHQGKLLLKKKNLAIWNYENVALRKWRYVFTCLHGSDKVKFIPVHKGLSGM